MYEEGYLDEGFMQEFFHHHSNVIFQPDFESKYYSGINPYTLGFNIFADIKRMSLNPTEEDKKWFPDIAGKGDWAEVFRYIVENFKDETFVLQYLSPKVIRDMKLFSIDDKEDDDHYEVEAIHDEQGYRKVRQSLSENYNRARYIPEIQVFNVDVYGDRTLTLSYTSNNEKDINLHNMDEILEAISDLWGFNVRLIQDDDDNDLIWDYEI
jgi:spore cortex formation protein SpoVR/YcgB (stage V sporulation)